MKRIALVALIAIFAISFGMACAQDAGAQKAAAPRTCPSASAVSGAASGAISGTGTCMKPKSSEGENVIGKVDSVMPAGADKGTKATIAVIDNAGEKTVFEITPTTTIYDVNMKPITLDAVKKDAAVKVKGTMVKEGTGVATFIRLMK